MPDQRTTPHLTSSRNVTVNLNDVPSASKNKVPVRTRSVASQVCYVVIAVSAITLLVAGVAIPVALAVTNQGSFSTTVSSSGTTTVPTTVTAVVTTTTVSFPECSSYTTISDATRLATAAGGSVCDGSTFTSSITWVRFTGAGGTQLTTTAPAANQCGTQAAGWYSGSLPSSGVRVNGTVCYVWGSQNCNWSNTVSVTNCGSFYVFGLIVPPVCNARYCTA